MKREIKFRGWNIILNEMMNVHDVPYGYNDILNSDEFIPMQFTGLLDKNGKEIYESDILFADRKTNKIGKVIFDGGCFCIDFGDDSNFIATKNGFEIIGNIHENPELLKKNC